MCGRDLRKGEAYADSGSDPQRNLRRGPGDDRTRHAQGSGAQRHPDPDLARALDNGKGGHPLHVDARHDQGRGAGA